MDTLKRIFKYILMIIGIYILTKVLVFIGFNGSYKQITLIGEVPSQITIEKAEANTKDGRVYGYISNDVQSNIIGKYIKVSIYNSNEELLTTKYLKIEDLQYQEKKLFRAKFTAKEAKKFSISIVNEEK